MDALSLLGWRRAIHEAYAAARAAPEPQQGWQRWRAARDRLFAEHPQSPLDDVSRFTGLPFAPYDERLRFTVPVRDADPVRIDVATSDGTVPLERVGRVDLPVGSLDVWWLAGYGGGLFLPFADRTNGGSTYGGGRYLLDTVKGADLGQQGDDLIVDLTSPTTRPAATAPAGRVRSPRRATASTSRSRPASSFCGAAWKSRNRRRRSVAPP